jgi:hypothetical protein
VKKYTTKEVAAKLHNEQLLEIINEQTNAPSGSKDWLRHYPAALTQLFEALTDEELATCQETMERWNKEGPSLGDQQRRVTSLYTFADVTDFFSMIAMPRDI